MFQRSILPTEYHSLYDNLEHLRNGCYAHAGLAVKVTIDELDTGELHFTMDTTDRNEYNYNNNQFVEMVQKIKKLIEDEFSNAKKKLADIHKKKPIKVISTKNSVNLLLSDRTFPKCRSYDRKGMEKKLTSS